MLTAVQQQADGAMAVTGDMTSKMDESSRRLSETYASFVEDLSGGFSRALGMFDENIHSVLGALNEKLEEIREMEKHPSAQAAKLQKETEGCVSALSRLQRAMKDMSAALEGKDKNRVSEGA